MIVSTSAPLPVNGQTPISAARIARSQAALLRIDVAEKLARFAVLGYCNDPGSYWPLGVNVMNDVAKNPMTPVPTVTATGSTVGQRGLPTVGPEAASAVVVPIDGTGSAIIPPPSYLPLTTNQGPGVPIIPPWMMGGFRLRPLRQPSVGTPATADMIAAYGGAPVPGVAATWGDALAFLPSPAPGCGCSAGSAGGAAGSAGGILGFVKDHAGLIALVVGGLVLARSKGGR